MEVDSDEEIRKTDRKQKKDEFEDYDLEEDSVVWEKNVVVCNSSSNTEMYCISYPASKRDAWDPTKFPMARFKKNVRLLEMRFIPDTKAGSYNRKKAESLFGESSSSPQKNRPQANDISSIRKNDEIYEGRAFINDHPIINTIGFMNNDQFYIHPIIGNFGMHRSISILNNQKKKGGGGGENEDDGMSTENEEEEEKANTSTGNVRVKFSRPETERQKKRREASALYREKVIASDVWIPMKVHLKEDQEAINKVRQISQTGVKREEENGKKIEDPTKCLEIRDLVNRAIICSIKEELVIESGKEHMLSKQRIDELGVDMQIKAHMVKSHVIRTSEMIELIGEGKLSRDAVIHHLQQCARLVNGVWVLQSDLLFNNLPPAHSNVAGRTDVYRSELWRNARDLALCLIDAGHRVTRLTLITCFKLSEKDAEEVLSTFGVKDEKERRWKLRIEKDETFLDDPSVQSVIISEKQKWVERFDELQKLLSAPKSKK